MTISHVVKRSSCWSGCVGMEIRTGRGLLGSGPVETLKDLAGYAADLGSGEQA